MPGQLLIHVQLIQWRCKQGQHLLIRNDLPFILWILEIMGFNVLPKSLHNLQTSILDEFWDSIISLQYLMTREYYITFDAFPASRLCLTALPLAE